MNLAKLLFFVVVLILLGYLESVIPVYRADFLKGHR